MWMILIGFMGSGKSTVGSRLAAMSGIGFMDLDDLVAEEAGRAVPEIFAAEGEAGFRRREREALESLPVGEPLVLATGGGLVDALDEPVSLRERGRVFWLDLAWHTAWLRLQGTEDARPLLAGASPAQVQELFLRRRPGYAAAADFRLRTDLAGAEQVARMIMVASGRGHGEGDVG